VGQSRYTQIKQAASSQRAARDPKGIYMRFHISAWIDSHYNDSGSEIPYEVHMAVLEGRDGIKSWTAARKGKR
jgi:hypothetical protein